MVQSFEMINDTLGLGRVGRYLRFRSHMLRNFHASALYNDGMSCLLYTSDAADEL